MSNVIDSMAAHHEAGHAVASIVLGLTFEKVRLDRDGGGGGGLVANAEQKQMRRRAFQRKGPDYERRLPDPGLTSVVVNWSIAWSIDNQFPMAVVVVNCPPFRGALTACHPQQCIHRHASDEFATTGTHSDFCRAAEKVARFNGRSATMMFASVRPGPAATVTPFTFLVCDDPRKIVRRVTISQRLGLFIRLIKTSASAHRYTF